MMGPETIKQVNRELQLQYIQSLRDELPDNPKTEYEFDLHEMLTRDIEEALRVLEDWEE